MAGGARITLMKNAEHGPLEKNPPAVHNTFAFLPIGNNGRVFILLFYLRQTMKLCRMNG